MEQVQPTQELSIHLGEDALLDNTVLKPRTEKTVHCLGHSLVISLTPLLGYAVSYAALRVTQAERAGHRPKACGWKPVRAEARHGTWFTTASPQGTPINADERKTQSARTTSTGATAQRGSVLKVSYFSNLTPISP